MVLNRLFILFLFFGCFVHAQMTKVDSATFYKVVKDPTMFIAFDYTSDSLRNILEENRGRFNNIKLNPTLLINKGKNTRESAGNIANAIKNNIDKDRNVVLVGHGSNRCGDNCCYTSININKGCGTDGSACHDDCYQEIEKSLASIGYNKIIIGTLEGSRTREVVLKELKEKEIDQVVIMPLLVLPGNHIVKDIKGDNSWESLFNENNIKTEVILKSLLEYEDIQKLYIDMISEALFNL